MPDVFTLTWARSRVVLFAFVVACTTVAGMAATQSPGAAVGVGEGPVIDSAACTAESLAASNDGSTGPVNLPFPVNFYGQTFNSLFVNNNGSVTFDAPLGVFTAVGGLDGTGRQIIAPFFADVDTTGPGSGIVTYGSGATVYAGRPAFCVDWINVGYFAAHTDKLNSFQLLLVDRSDRAAGDFDIVFNYDKVKWETGDANGGSGGTGGSSARAGFSNGTGAPGTSLAIPGSGIDGAFLDSNPATALVYNSLDPFQPGRYVFEFHSGNTGTARLHGTISGGGPTNPLPGALVQVCPAVGGQCVVNTANSAGQYSVFGLAAGNYVMTAFPPSNTTFISGSTNVSDLTTDENRQVDVNLDRAGTGGLHGTITGGGPTNPLPGARVQVCPASGGQCVVTTANTAGQYSVFGLAADDYALTAFPPSNTNFNPASVNVVGLAVSEDRQVDLNLDGTTPPPPGTSIVGPNGGGNVSAGGLPVVYWQDPLTLTTTGCPGGTATWEVLQGGVVLAGYSGIMAEGPPGTYTASVPALYPNHGAATIHIVITCPDGSTQLVDFDIYIDPSGVVKDTTGATLAGATVTLFRSDSAGGPFTQVPDGDSIMSPANRANPDTTDAVGHFGWDVIAGFYKVQATKAGCHAPGNPGQAFAESAVLDIPPPVTTLELVLDCTPVLPTVSVSGTSQAEGSGGGTTAFPFTIALSSASATPVKVQYYTADISATAPSDYTRIASTVLTFAPGETSKVVNVAVGADDDRETNERFSVKLTHPNGATLGTATGVATIVNDDLPLPALSISDVTQAEGTGGDATPFTFTVSLDTPSTQTVTVPWYTVGVEATSGTDFVAVAPTTLSFAPGETSKPVTVLVRADDIPEANERFFVRLNPPTHATRAKAVGVGKILNDD